MNNKWDLKIFLALLVLFSLTLLSPSCDSSNPTANKLRLSGPGDLYYLSIVINKQASQNAAISPVKMRVSADCIKELKEGKTDAVLLGRELLQEEVNGLKDYILAYDAVCIILDENSYLGGTITSGPRPVRKSAGLHDLPGEALKDIFSRAKWEWSDGFYNGNQMIDPGSFLLEIDSIAWLPGTKTLETNFFFPVGKFNTQSVIYQKLGLSEKELLSNWKAFTSSRFDIEEEVLSYEYNASNYSQENGMQEFPFKLAFASRRAMTVAPQHIPVRVVSINGIDPLENPHAVYDDTYIFPRKIHLLTRKDTSAQGVQLASFLKSSEGQQLLAGAGYLPLRESDIKN